MARVVEIRLLENCLDSSAVKEFRLDSSVDEEIMRLIARQGDLQYFPSFPRPYFRIDRARTYVVQGVLGNRHFRVTFSPLASGDAEDELKSLTEGK